MKYKVHWIIDGMMEVEASSKEDAENILRKNLEEYVKNSDQLMNKFIAKSIQGTAYAAGTDEVKDDQNSDDEKNT
jgi:hypothetical protein